MDLQFISTKVQFHLCNIPLLPELHKEFFYFLPNSLNDAHPGRVNEFIAGRYCAHEAAKKLGESIKTLPIGSNREPLWPHHLMGSISHTKDIAVAAVAKNETGLKIGIDIEKMILDSKKETIETIVARSEDLEYLKILKQDQNLLYTILFSAKESLYKALYPYCQCFIEFNEARILEINFLDKTFTLELISTKNKLEAFNKKYSGQFQIMPDAVVTYIEEKAN